MKQNMTDSHNDEGTAAGIHTWITCEVEGSPYCLPWGTGMLVSTAFPGKQKKQSFYLSVFLHTWVVFPPHPSAEG